MGERRSLPHQSLEHPPLCAGTFPQGGHSALRGHELDLHLSKVKLPLAERQRGPGRLLCPRPRLRIVGGVLRSLERALRVSDGALHVGRIRVAREALEAGTELGNAVRRRGAIRNADRDAKHQTRKQRGYAR
jgi:hypothetical protein